MSHPYKSQADSSNKSKRSSMEAKGGASKLPNLSMNGSYKDVKESTGNIQQHKDQNAAPGMKRGGRLDKPKRSGKKSKIALDLVPATPPSPDAMIGAQAGAGGLSPPPAPASPMMPMRKRGGAIKKADGGSVSLGKYPLTKGGIGSGEGRLELSKKN